MRANVRDRCFWTVNMALLIFVLSACQSTAAMPLSASSGFRQVPVEHVHVEIGQGSPIPVEIFVSGTWPDLCAQLAEIDHSLQDFQFELNLLATPVDTDCPPDYLGLPFRIAIPLNMVEMPEGTYTIIVNGIRSSFDWPFVN